MYQKMMHNVLIWHISTHYVTKILMHLGFIWYIFTQNLTVRKQNQLASGPLVISCGCVSGLVGKL